MDSTTIFTTALPNWRRLSVGTLPRCRSMNAATDALFAGYGVRRLIVRMGGTVPNSELFQRHLQRDTVFVSFSVADEDYHSTK